MVQNTDTHMGTHTHLGEARVLAHTRIWATRTRMGSQYAYTGIPYAYGLPIRVWAAHMHMGQPIRVWAEYMYGTEQWYSFE